MYGFFEKPSTAAEKPTVHVWVLYQSKNPTLRNLLKIAFRRERIFGENNSGNRVFTEREIHPCRNDETEDNPSQIFLV